ncbi:MAG: hypothetical protein M3450_00575, partial [Actinomycetota bacterium]|nr:hypothetical protein [Actinomycetota bacterium]
VVVVVVRFSLVLALEVLMGEVGVLELGVVVVVLVLRAQVVEAPGQPIVIVRHVVMGMRVHHGIVAVRLPLSLLLVTFCHGSP